MRRIQCFCGVSKNTYAKNGKYCSLKCFYESRRQLTTNQDYFDKIDTPEKAYWLGFLYADGNITKLTKKQKCINLELAQKDKMHVVNFARIFGSTVYRTKRNSYKVTITSSKLHSALIKKGLTPDKTNCVSDIIVKKVSMIDFKKDFVRGFFDGDGGFSRNQKTNNWIIHFTSTNKLLLEWIKSYLTFTTGSNGSIFKRKSSKAFVFSCSGKSQCFKIADHLYGNCTVMLQRKFEKYKHLDRSTK